MIYAFGQKEVCMSKTITSPVKRWAGTVTIADPLTIPQAQAIEAGLEKPEQVDGKDTIWVSQLDVMRLPAVMVCVEKWELAGFPEVVTLETFPASPRGDSHKLADWIFTEILKVYSGEAEVPNE